MSTPLRLSLAGNLILAAVVVALLWSSSPRPVPSDGAPSQTRAATASISAPAHHRTASPGPLSTGSALDHATIAELEQKGIPRDVLVNVLLEDLNHRSDERVRALQKKFAPGLVPYRDYLELSRQSDAERTRTLKEALGEDGYRAWDKEQTLAALNHAGVTMTDAEAEAAYRLQKEFDKNNRELQEAMQDGIADRAEVAKAEAAGRDALNRQLEQLLGKQRFDEMSGTTDPTTEVYRTFGDLHPTPDQANAVVETEKAYQDSQTALAKQLSEGSPNPADLAAQLTALNAAHDASMEKIFGADAYVQMRQQKDPTYKTLTLYAETWGLQNQQVQGVYQTLHTFESQADQMRQAAELEERAGQPVNWRQVNAAIEQARQQTEAAVQSQIGPDGLQHLKDNGLLSTP